MNDEVWLIGLDLHWLLRFYAVLWATKRLAVWKKHLEGLRNGIGSTSWRA